MRGSARLTFGLLALLFVGSASALDYQVRRGDTLSAIANRYGVTVDQLYLKLPSAKHQQSL